MKEIVNYRLLVIALAAAFAWFSVSEYASAKGRKGAGVVFVTSQQLYYDSFVTAEKLPPRGRFQKLVVVDGQPQTEFGPGDKGYVGGRWWIDVNSNGVMDGEDSYFLCPLLGPGRENP